MALFDFSKAHMKVLEQLCSGVGENVQPSQVAELSPRTASEWQQKAGE